MDKTYLLDDLKEFSDSSFIEWEKLYNKTIFISGATGLIGTAIINGLLYANKVRHLNIKIIGLVRSIERTKNRYYSEENIMFYKGTVEDKISIEENIDFIIHAANPTSSSFFVNSPVETIQISLYGMINMLELAKRKKVEGFVFLSSMEVYGMPEKGHVVKENELAGFDTTLVRNSYPISKQVCDALCSAYSSEYSVPAKVVRLTQTFGPGVEYNDGRVFAEFMRCVVEKKNIVLHTKGETERCYLYTNDAASAILTVLLSGKNGESYTVANANTYCSIKTMADIVCSDIANGEISVEIKVDKIDRGYANELHMMLDTSKLEAIGWKPKSDLIKMYKNMISVFERVDF